MKIILLFLSFFIQSITSLFLNVTVMEEIELTVNKLISEEGVQIKDKGFVVVNILQVDEHVQTFSVSYIYNQWDSETVLTHFFLYNEYQVLLRFSPKLNDCQKQSFLRNNKKVFRLKTKDKENIIKSLGSTGKGYYSYSPITYLVMLEDGSRNEKRYKNIPPPPGYSIWD